MEFKTSRKLNRLAREMRRVGGQVHADYIAGYCGDVPRDFRGYIRAAIEFANKSNKKGKPIYEVDAGDDTYPAYFIGELDELIRKFDRTIKKQANRRK